MIYSIKANDGDGHTDTAAVEKSKLKNAKF